MWYTVISRTLSERKSIPMKFQYLGTAAAEGIPALFCSCDLCREAARRGGKDLRLRSGAIVNDRLLIDLNPDLFAAKLRFGLDLSQVRNALITHAHSDHFDREMMGFFTPTCAHIAKTGDLFHLWGSAYTANAWKEYTSAMQMKEPELERYVVFHTLKPFETAEIEGVKVTALPARHSCPESLIFVLEQSDARLLYGNDTGPLADDTWAWLENENSRPFTTVSLDSTMGYPENHYYGHMSLKENIETKQRMLKIGAADGHTRFLCHHFSHNALVLHTETEAFMKPHGFDIAYDGLTFDA